MASRPHIAPVWNRAPESAVPIDQRLEHVRYCSPFAAGLLDRYPEWADRLDEHQPPLATGLAAAISKSGLDDGLRQFRNRQMLRIIWRDLCDLASLDETFADLTSLAEICLAGAIEGNSRILREKFGTPVDADGEIQQLSVIGLGKFGGGELNLSSDIDVMFCYGSNGECRGGGRRSLSNEQFFTRLARAVISSLSEMTKEGFCFRVDARLRPFGDSGPLCTSLAALEQYYQNEGRDWERYALIKARPVAGELSLGGELMDRVRPFVYRRYIDFTAIEALQDMHASVIEDARRRDILDDIKRGPGGIREIEFLVQCFQLLRGGREPTLRTPSLAGALRAIEELGLLDAETTAAVRADYVFLRRLENRIQALRDRQTHSIPDGEDLPRLTRAMGLAEPAELEHRLQQVRQRVTERFHSIFPSRTTSSAEPKWVDVWHQLHTDRQPSDADAEEPEDQALAVFLRGLQRLSLSGRAQRRLDQFMPVLLHRLDRHSLQDRTLHRVFDLVLAICRRSPYLVLLVQNAPALDRLIDLFARSEWIANSVIRFPALLDELIAPNLGHQVPTAPELGKSMTRLLETDQDTETVLAGLNYLKLASTLRIAVAQLEGNLDSDAAQTALANLAVTLLDGVLRLATVEIEARHGRISNAGATSGGAGNTLAIIAYGSLGANEPGYDSDLDIVFLYTAEHGSSDGTRSLPAERYYARLAQKLLGFLNVLTPSGRLYEVDTRLRPNGRAGSLVSSLDAFADYQLHHAWTWELQALARARFVAGDETTGSAFRHIRRQAMARPRELSQLRADLSEMRSKMARQHGAGSAVEAGPKHQPGGLVDIEFIAQCGVLATAAEHPSVLETTATLEQLRALSAIGWLAEADAKVLEETARALHQQRMLETLTGGEQAAPVETRAAAEVFARLLGSLPDGTR
jgi:glutamate-ammonia-ligase adenylyltransferase